MTDRIGDLSPATEGSVLTPDGSIKSVSIVSTGSVEIHPQRPNSSRIPRMVWLVGSQEWKPPRPINAFLVEHADGLVLLDTGQDRASVADPDDVPGGVTGFLHGRLARFQISPHGSRAKAGTIATPPAVRSSARATV